MSTPLLFPLPDRETLIRKIREIPLVGRVIAPKRAIECSVCRRRITAMGRLPCPGYPTCDQVNCELTRMGPVSKLFTGSPYGSALPRNAIGAFARVLDLPSGRVLLQRQPIVLRAEPLADGFIRLLRWQAAYDAWERWKDPIGYREGRIRIPPPRRIEDVISIRSIGKPVQIESTDRLPSETRAELMRFFEEGEDAALAGFGLSRV